MDNTSNNAELLERWINCLDCGLDIPSGLFDPLCLRVISRNLEGVPKTKVKLQPNSVKWNKHANV